MSKEVILFSPGKTKERYLQTGIDKYAKLLQRYISLKLVFPEIKSPSAKDSVFKKIEADYFFKWLEKQKYSFFCVLDEHGKLLTSSKFSKVLENKINLPYPVIFFIGGPFGIDERVKQKADYLLSLSPLTFLHEMSRVIFLEQLYRAFQIQKGTQYHK
jgi:23S rRNA (pseudouridine1915-N3)-methyltransferase